MTCRLLALLALASLAGCHAHSDAPDAAPPASAPPAAAPPPAVPAPKADLPPMPQPTGYLERRADGTCWWNHGMYFCPPGAQCKPTPPARQVACPPEVQPAGDEAASVGAYTESRADGTCLTGPDATHLRRMRCPWDGEKR